MRDRLIEIVDKSKEEYANDVTDHTETEYIVEGLLNKGAILPPYKCGMVVYVVRSQTSNGKNLYMRQERIEQYRTSNNGTFMTFESGRVSVRNDQWSRSVFATQEEAEQAMKGEKP